MAAEQRIRRNNFLRLKTDAGMKGTHTNRKGILNTLDCIQIVIDRIPNTLPGIQNPRKCIHSVGKTNLIATETMHSGSIRIQIVAECIHIASKCIHFEAN